MRFVSVKTLSSRSECIEILKSFNEMGLFGKCVGDKCLQLSPMNKDLVDMYLAQVMMRLHELSFPIQHEEKFGVKLLNHGDKKINIIKIVRYYTGLTLKEAKNFVEALPAFIPFDANDVFDSNAINKDSAKKIVDELTEQGATANMVLLKGEK